MKIGYARVSTDEQNLDLQLDALKADRCDQIFTDKGISGSAEKRPGLGQALALLGPDDVLVVWKLDRLGRSLSHLVGLLADLKGRDIGFRSITEGIDIGTSIGKLTYHMIGALAEFERDLIRERTLEGLAAAKRRGVKVGRKPALTHAQAKHAAKLLKDEGQRSVARSFGVTEKTLRENLKRYGLK
jgi:DNA invertase Pin-like site-specific DNA recombinase